jgi:glycine cleavage system H lipoate-binding protein
MKTMAIHAEAVEILVRKSRFEPEVALGVAEAIEVSINLAQLVTVPVLDARMLELKTELKAEIQALRLEFKTELADGLGKLSTEIQKVNANLSTEIQKVNANLGTEIQKVNANLGTEIQKVNANLSTEIQKVNANLMRWVLLTMLGSTALSMAARSLMSMLSN